MIPCPSTPDHSPRPRVNTYIGLIFATALHGQEGVATFALATAVVVPPVNIICVNTLAAYGDKSATLRRLPVLAGIA